MWVRLAALVLIALASVEVRPVAAQTTPSVVVPRPLVAIARRDLRFGTVLPGIPSQVRVSDVRDAGLFEVQGGKYGVVRLELALPPTLVSASGHELLLSFGPGDGAVATDMGRFHGGAFDPREPITASLAASGKLYVRLGGTVYPTLQQAGGVYQATIFITVYDLGS